MTDNFMALVRECVSAQIGIEIDEKDFDYLEHEWHSWLFNMGKYSNLTPMVKADLLEHKAM